MSGSLAVPPASPRSYPRPPPSAVYASAMDLLTASVRKGPGNSGDPHSSCTIPPLMLWDVGWLWLWRGQELSPGEGHRERSPLVAAAGLCRAAALCLLRPFSFPSSFCAAEPQRPVFKTSGYFATEQHMLRCLLLNLRQFYFRMVQKQKHRRQRRSLRQDLRRSRAR